MASIFTQIMRGELPAYKLYEDEHVFVFLALEQIQPGHALVVPKQEVDSFLQVEEPLYSHLFQITQRVGRAIKAAMECPRVGLAVQGFEVAHCHIHVIPLWDKTDLNFAKGKRLSAEEMKQIQSQLLIQLAEMH